MTSPLCIRALRAFALSLIGPLSIAVGNLRASISLKRTWFARWRHAFPFRPRPMLSRYAPSGFRRIACLFMAVVMFLQVPASPHVSRALVDSASAKAVNSWHDSRYWLYSSGWAARMERLRDEYLPGIGVQARPQAWDGRGAPRHSSPTPQKVETRQDKERRIARVKIFPGDVEIKTGEQVIFNAVAFDDDGDSIYGLAAQWSAFDEENSQSLTVSAPGTFVSGAPGRFTVTAEIGGHREQVKVIVSGEPRRPNLKSRSETPKSSRESRRVGLSRAPVQGDQKRIAGWRKRAGAPALPGLRAASSPMAARPALQVQGEDQTGWNSANNDTMDDIGSERGQVPGRIVDGGAGSGNFQFAAPAVVLGGRGIDLNLLFHQNSRVWHRAGSEITFDIDRDTLVAGWNLGFGKIVMAGDAYFLIDSDGTRHPYQGTLRGNFPTPAGALQTFEGHTSDGTFIDYYAEGYKPEFDNSGGRNIILAWAALPDGTRIEYGAPANYAIYPTRITDAHGNFISITYRNDQGPQIETITDALSRVIRFHYDGSGLLTAITVPGLGGGERVTVRLQYQWLTLSNAGSNYGFASGLTAKVRQSTVPVVRAIYYPGTGNGYWFGDGDSYSPYGMIRKVSERRGMTFDNAPLDQQGAIGPGMMSREMVYNYPQSGGSLSDAPAYTQMTEDWAGRSTASAPVTHFSVVDRQDVLTRETTITRPDGTRVVQITSANQFFGETYGMSARTDIYRDSSLLSRSRTSWERVFGYMSYGAPRPYRAETTDERGRTTVTEYSYDTNFGSRYNAVTDMREYGYGGELLRRIHTRYLNDGNYNGSLQNSGMLWWKPVGSPSGGPTWSGPHIFNLISVTEVYAADDATRLARAERQYDGVGLINTPGMAQHNATHNPYAPEYDPRTWYRGNVTQIKRYADALSLDEETAVVENQTYDVAGNLRAQTTSCCELTSFVYTTDTQYAWPESQTSGSPSDPTKQITSGATYDYNTGLILSLTDANGRVSNTEYDSNTLRPIRENLPTGAYLYHIYDDNNLYVADSVYEAGQGGANVASRSDKYLDGLGRVIKEVAFGKDYARDVVETRFDNLGRVWRQSRPYRANSDLSPAETVQWSEVSYDSLDRSVQTVSPDGSVVTRAYNQSPDPSSSSGQPGQTVKVTDPLGRERWARSDALGRLVEVAEPDPGGDGSLSSTAMVTTYNYDALDRLLQVNQGEQLRRFQYDSLGRLTHQKLAELDATLDDNGNWVGAGSWSDRFFYDTRSNMTTRVDARGVRTLFFYNNDPLNRLQSVQYNKDGAPAHIKNNIPNAYNVPYPYINEVYEYMSSGDKRRMRSIGLDAGIGNQTMDYDIEGRISQVFQTFGGRESYPLLTNYLWDSLGRIKEVRYPQQYGAGETRKVITHKYDMASRIESLNFGGATLASNPGYNAASQMTSLNVGGQIAESYGYDPKTGLMTNQQARRGANLLVDLKYNYTLNNDPNNNGPKTGRLTSFSDLKNQARNRAYEYDKLGRLIKVKGGVNAISAPDWTQAYNYDRYGNKIAGSGGGTAPATEVWFDDSLPAGASFSAYVPPSATVALRSINGYYVFTDQCCLPPGNVAANRAAIGPWETFRVVDINEGSLESGDQIHLRTTDGNRDLYAYQGGEPQPGGIVFNDWNDTITSVPWPKSTWAQFTIRKADGSPGVIDNDTDVSLQSTGGYYMVAEGGGAPEGSPPPAGRVYANRGAVGPWETFRLILLSGSIREGIDESWEWMTSDPTPYSGGQSHRSKGRSGLHQHYFWGATQTMQVNAGDKLFAYVYLDPGALPSEIMLQWNENGSWEHRAYWGANNIGWGTDGTESRRRMGPLPQAGGWVKLEVPASAVGLEGKTLNGMAFTLYDGQAWWDKAGKTNESAGQPNPVIGRDGFDNLTHNALNNRITSPGFDYDPAGNQTRAVINSSGTQQQYRYDSANRLAQVADAAGSVVATYAYGESNQRLVSVEGGVTKFFAWDGGKIIAEYEASGTNALVWKTSYIYLGGKLLATTSGAGGTETRFHHPDRLGTRLTTDAGGTVVTEQFGMPFGNMQPFTSVYGGENPYQHPTLGNPSKKRFTSYDRSDAMGLDYAVNRFYNPRQGRFTQVDPIGMGAAEPANPQSLNLYSYVENDPINSADPLGLNGQTVVFRPFPSPTGGGGGGIGIGPFSFSFSFSLGSLRQSKRNQQRVVRIKSDNEVKLPAGGPLYYVLNDGTVVADECRDDKIVSAAVDLAGIGVNIGEYSIVFDGKWRGVNGKWYPINSRFPGSKYTGMKSHMIGRAKGYKLAGKALFSISAGVSIIQGVQNIGQENYAGAGKNVLDIGAGYVGFAGGPTGAVISGAYVLTDVFIGWDNAAKPFIATGNLIKRYPKEVATSCALCPRNWENHNPPSLRKLGFPYGCLDKR